MNWRPMSEAPRDGTRILAYRGGFGQRVMIVYWEPPDRETSVLAGYWRDTAMFRSSAHTLKHPPLGWMPLPDVPQ